MSSLIHRLRSLARMEHSDFLIGDEAADEILDLISRLSDAEIKIKYLEDHIKNLTSGSPTFEGLDLE